MIGNGEAELLNPVVKALLERRSIRHFTEETIPESILDMILKTGTYAPSGYNLQTWRFTVMTDKKEMADFKERIQTAAESNRVVFHGFNNPAVLILISNDKRAADGIQDSACAAENIMLAAHSYGIGSVWLNPLMTLCDVPEIRERLDEYKIPQTHNVWAMIALGYPAEEGKLLARKTNTIYRL